MFQTSNFQELPVSMETDSAPLDSFIKWKNTLDSLYLDVFGNTTENLPDMPYRSMFEEKVEENLIVLRMHKILSDLQKNNI